MTTAVFRHRARMGKGELVTRAEQRSVGGRPGGLAVAVAVIGVVVTAGLVIATVSARNSNEDRLLRQLVDEAALVLTASLPAVETPLAAAVEVVEVTDGSDQAAFRRILQPLIDEGTRFVSASLWRLDSSPPQPLVVIGEAPKLAAQPPDAVRAFLERSAATATRLAVLPLLVGAERRLGYSYTSTELPVRFVAYAEARIQPSPRPPAAPGSPFSGLDNAIYFGNAEDPAQMLTTTSTLIPLGGRTASATVPFGDSTLLLVMTPKGHLGGTLLAILPWLVGIVGALTTLGSALLTRSLIRRRHHAEELAIENARLYADQRSVARELQQSLLPRELPTFAGLELAVKYMPGVAGVEIGGDWYDVVELDRDRLLFVVGDVSGRGLEAGTIMAALRYAIRAFASEGDRPGVILTKLTRLLDVGEVGHFATVLCATVDVGGHAITFANAGHPNPLLIHDGVAEFIGTAVGVPIGVTRDAHYEETTFAVPSSATVLAFTDGLFERKRETVDDGLERLRVTASRRHDDVDHLLDAIIAAQELARGHDDIAVLGATWKN